MVSTHKRGAVIPTSSFKVFLAPNHRDVAYSSTLPCIITIGLWGLEDKDSYGKDAIYDCRV